MSATANLNITRAVDQTFRAFPVAAGVTIYRDTNVGLDPAGYLHPFIPGYHVFAGLSTQYVDNSTGSAGAKECEVQVGGDFELTITSVALTDRFKAVFATDDDAYALSGHPEAFVGRIIQRVEANKALVRMRTWGEMPLNGEGNVQIDVDFARTQEAATDENDGYGGLGQLIYTGIGAGLTAGTTGALLDEATGEKLFLLDNDSEAETVAMETRRVFNTGKGMSLRWEGRKSVVAATAADIDVGFAGGIALTDTQRADMQATTASFLYALFHIDAEDDNVDYCSDDNATVVGVTDTGFDNEVATNHVFEVRIRPHTATKAAAAQFWVDGVLKATSATGIAVAGATAVLMAAYAGIEKGANTDVPAMRTRRFRALGSMG